MIDRFKQHLLLPLIGVAVGTLVWQLYLLSTASSVTELPKEPTPKPVALNQTSHITPIEQHTTNLAESRELSAKQLQYLQLVNELRITQVKKLIAQDNEAIALSQQHVQKANSNLGQTDPMPKSKTTPQADVVAVTPTRAQQEEGVKLVYTGEQNGIWNATINVQGRLYDVVKGTKLPSGDTVANIDQDVVILSQGPWKKVLSFYDMTRYYQPSQETQSRDAQAAMKVEQPEVVASVKPEVKKVAPVVAVKTESKAPVAKLTTPSVAKAETKVVSPVVATVEKKVAAPVVAKIEKKVVAPVVAKVETKLATPVVAKVETKVVTPVVAKVETKVAAPVVAKIEKKVVAPVVAKVETKVVTPVVAKVETKVTSPLLASKVAAKPAIAVAHTTSEKTTLLITKPVDDDTDVPSLLMKPHGVTAVVAKVEPKKPVVEIAKKEVVVVAKTEPVKKIPTQVAVKKPIVEIPVKVIAMIGDSKEVKKPVPAKPTVLRHYNDIERQLLLQDPQQYTLQVFAGDDLASVQKFINQNNLAGKTKIYTRYQNNHPQHVVVIEHFKTAEDALEGLSHLPIELHQYAPEIKSLASVQQELKTVS